MFAKPLPSRMSLPGSRRHRPPPRSKDRRWPSTTGSRPARRHRRGVRCSEGSRGSRNRRPPRAPPDSGRPQSPRISSVGTNARQRSKALSRGRSPGAQTDTRLERAGADRPTPGSARRRLRTALCQFRIPFCGVTRGELELHSQGEQMLLCAVVEIAFDLAALGMAGCGDSCAGPAQLFDRRSKLASSRPLSRRGASLPRRARVRDLPSARSWTK